MINGNDALRKAMKKSSPDALLLDKGTSKDFLAKDCDLNKTGVFVKINTVLPFIIASIQLPFTAYSDNNLVILSTVFSSSILRSFV